jgi:hypothetical protein
MRWEAMGTVTVTVNDQEWTLVPSAECDDAGFRIYNAHGIVWACLLQAVGSAAPLTPAR